MHHHHIETTAPASFWYLQQFKVPESQQLVVFVNLMTYVSSIGSCLLVNSISFLGIVLKDIHGSWDITFGTGAPPHTAIPDVADAVNLFLKAVATIDKINLSLGFYHRTFTLSSSSCRTHGYPFTGPGKAGPCTGAEGFLSYDEMN